MDDYFMDQVIDSFCSDDGYEEGKYHINEFYEYDPNFYYNRIRFTIVHETKKAYLFEVSKGQFWCPKSLLRNVKIKNNDLRGLLWNGFDAKFIPKTNISVDEFDDLDDKPMKKKNIFTSKDDVFAQYNLEWLR